MLGGDRAVPCGPLADDCFAATVLHVKLHDSEVIGVGVCREGGRVRIGRGRGLIKIHIEDRMRIVGAGIGMRAGQRCLGLHLGKPDGEVGGEFVARVGARVGRSCQAG